MKRVITEESVVIDCHTHCGIDFCNLYRMRFPLCQSVNQLQELIKLNKVDYAITFPMPETMYYNQYEFAEKRIVSRSPIDGCSFPFELENTYLLSEISHFQIDTVMPFLGFSLREKVREQAGFIEMMNEKFYVYGLKYHPFYDKKTIIDLEKNKEILDVIYKYDLPIMCHTGDDEFSNPNNVVKFAKNHPKIRICLAHMGGFNNSILEQAMFLKNVYFDCSPLNQMCERMKLKYNDKMVFSFDKPEKVLEEIFTLVKDKVLWGTDYPWIYSAKLTRKPEMPFFQYSDEIRTLRKQSPNVISKIANGNVCRYLFGT